MKVDYKKILNKIIKDDVHNLDKIESFIEEIRNSAREIISISLEEIINNNEWTVEEKIELLRYFGYSESGQKIKYLDEKNNEEQHVSAEFYTIKNGDIVSFEALMRVFKDKKSYYFSIDEGYKEILRSINEECKVEYKKAFYNIFFKYLNKSDLERLLKTEYTASDVSTICDCSIMKDIIASKDIELIEKYIECVDVNSYFNDAIKTGDTNIVKLFIDKGADVNYVPEEVILGFLTPLKTAISNNDYEMVKFLVENGAKVDFRVIDGDFYSKLAYYKVPISGGWNLLYEIKGNRLKENSSDEKKLKNIRQYTPLEFATKISDDNLAISLESYGFRVYFDGASSNDKNCLNIGRSYEDIVKRRSEIVNYLVDLTEDKSSINYTDLLVFSFVTNDLERFKKYAKLALDNKYVFNSGKLDYLINHFLTFRMMFNNDMFKEFLDFIGTFSRNDELYILIFNKYMEFIKKNIYSCKTFFMNDFVRELLNRIEPSKRNELIIVPYCHTISDLEELIKLGFDINQVNEEGKNILICLITERSRLNKFEDKEILLFNYLLNNIDITHKDNDGKTALYYAMIKFPTDREFMYKQEGPISVMEAFTVELIKRMPKEEVNNEDIMKVLDERMNYYDTYGDKIDNLYVCKHHERLYSALIDKGVVLSKVVLSNIFDSIYSKSDEDIEYIKTLINYDETLDFIFGKLDYNTQFQNIDIVGMYNSLLALLEQSSTYEEFKPSLIKFGENIDLLKQFYNECIMKKFNPQRYMAYAKEKTGTIYDGLDEMVLNIIIKALIKFGNDKLLNILTVLPNFNLNTIVVDADVGLNYWDYYHLASDFIGVDEEGEPIYGDEHFEAKCVYPNYDDKIVFTGGLMQYAIITDNIEMAKLLQSKGVSFALQVEDDDCTWDYVNSKKMLSLMEETLGLKKEDEFNSEEYSLYLKFMNSKKDN